MGKLNRFGRVYIITLKGYIHSLPFYTFLSLAKTAERIEILWIDKNFIYLQ